MSPKLSGSLTLKAPLSKERIIPSGSLPYLDLRRCFYPQWTGPQSEPDEPACYEAFWYYLTVFRGITNMRNPHKHWLIFCHNPAAALNFDCARCWVKASSIILAVSTETALATNSGQSVRNCFRHRAIVC